ncbi:glutathione S-transferase family protein [Azomonas macrocytogenes]|uniref:Glutathione S-transferase n=1 Tax=Azomonas macrocytogenes TaxID=69962 RepID=A0A839T0E2_AZOMA|nr:glutathione S-transferase N-terminal domain-containing protein [Azomonas macrocytogenes]MBB3103037.1 glutathione S-transferase [Azomonas macrocytogenes]
MTLKLYMTPGSCSTGINILMEELELVFEAYLVNLMAGEQYKPEYLAINPKATIPTLVLDDGSALTDFAAIAWWLASTYAERKKLLPEEPKNQARVLEAMNHVINTVHGEGFARIFTTEAFAPNGTAAEHEAVKAMGREIIDRGFAVIDKQLEGQMFLVERLTIADLALFYVEFWADRTGISLPENCSNHYQRLLQRPAVRQVLYEEGYGAIYQ